MENYCTRGSVVYGEAIFKDIEGLQDYDQLRKAVLNCACVNQVRVEIENEEINKSY